MRSGSAQRGVALLVALLVVALASLLIAALIDGGQLAAARTRNLLRGNQADAYARGLEAYAAQVLIRDAGEGIDSNSDIWAMPLAPTAVPGGSISAAMRDLNGCLNLNNLVANGQPQQLWIGRFTRLLGVLNLSPAIADTLVDWIDADHRRRAQGAEDAYYASREPDYRAANRPMADISELRLVAGVDARVYATLEPHVCALPSATAINLNTATIPVLQSLADGISQPLAERIHQQGNAHWPDVANALQVWQRGGVQLGPDAQRGLAVASEFFEAEARIELDGIVLRRRILIQRNAGIRILARSQ